jgi:hypothetical protein
MEESAGWLSFTYIYTFLWDWSHRRRHFVHNPLLETKARVFISFFYNLSLNTSEAVTAKPYQRKVRSHPSAVRRGDHGSMRISERG